MPHDRRVIRLHHHAGMAAGRPQSPSSGEDIDCTTFTGPVRERMQLRRGCGVHGVAQGHFGKALLLLTEAAGCSSEYDTGGARCGDRAGAHDRRVRGRCLGVWLTCEACAGMLKAMHATRLDAGGGRGLCAHLAENTEHDGHVDLSSVAHRSCGRTRPHYTLRDVTKKIVAIWTHLSK